MKIKICFVAPKAYPLFNPTVTGVFGGSEVDLYYLATELARDGDFQVSFVVADYGQAATEVSSGVTLIKSLSPGSNPIIGAWRVWQALQRADSQFYMLKTASPGTPLVAYFCRRYDRKFVYRTANSRECDGDYLRRHRLLGRAFAWSLRQAELVLAQSRDDAENLLRTVGVAAKVIPNGHRLTIIEQERNRDIILWAGRSAVFKRPELFIDLADSMRQQQFVMICQRATGDSHYDKLIERARPMKNLDFISRVPFHEIDSFFQRARVLVNTSDSEGFPNTFIQACKCATPILSLGVDPDGFLGRHRCGICCMGEIRRLKETLEYMLENDRCVELGRNGLEYARQHHDITEVARQYKKLFVTL